MIDWNAIQWFPTLIGQGWSVHKKPRFDTRVAMHATGREARSNKYRRPCWDFELTFDALDIPAEDGSSYADNAALDYDSFGKLAGFFLEMQGRADPFLYQDPTDSVYNGQIAVGDGVSTKFVVTRLIGGYAEEVGFVGGLFDTQVDGVDNDCDLENPNVIVFAAPPAAGAVITAGISYEFVCRFSEDVQDYEEFMARLSACKTITFQTVRPMQFAVGVAGGVPCRLMVFDESCHLFVSDDMGATWVYLESPRGPPASAFDTMHDGWTDLITAVNDGDFVNIGTVDQSYTGMNIGTPLTFTTDHMVAWNPGTDIDAATTAAMSFGGQIILVPVLFQFNPARDQFSAVFLSRDHAASWTELTGIGTTGTGALPKTYDGWLLAAMGAGGATMYVQPINGHLYKSVDGGGSWTEMTSSPVLGTNFSGFDVMNFNEWRMRCSANGQVIAMSEAGRGNGAGGGDFYISVDGGTTWRHTSFDKLTGGSGGVGGGGGDVFYLDFGMTPDASVIFVTVSGNSNVPFVSYDQGQTWIERAYDPLDPNWGVCCDISPDGWTLFTATQSSSGGGNFELSRDGGVTWQQGSIKPWPDRTAQITDAGYWVACAVLPL